MHRLPIKLTKEPLIDSTVEIRFESVLDKRAVFGVVYFALKDTYPNVEPLELSQLPGQFLEASPEFSDKPLYRIRGDRFQIQVGPTLIRFIVMNRIKVGMRIPLKYLECWKSSKG